MAAEFVAEGQFGFAAQTLRAGVRWGRRRTASDLVAIAGQPDGNLHAVWVSSAKGSLADDAIALMETSDAFFKVGARLSATEAAAAALRADSVPDSVASHS